MVFACDALFGEDLAEQGRKDWKTSADDSNIDFDGAAREISQRSRANERSTVQPDNVVYHGPRLVDIMKSLHHNNLANDTGNNNTSSILGSSSTWVFSCRPTKLQLRKRPIDRASCFLGGAVSI